LGPETAQVNHGPTSTCYGECAAAWPPLLTKGAPSAAAGLDSKLLGTTTRNDGSLQVTYNAHPLYYYSGDKGEEVMCQHVQLHGGFWYVVSASGAANMAAGHGMMAMGRESSMSHGAMGHSTTHRNGATMSHEQMKMTSYT
jgi:hypothetical protein